MKTVISSTRLRPDDVEMKDRNGVTIYVRSDATIGELLKAGVQEVALCESNAPLPPNWYKDTGGKLPQRTGLEWWEDRPDIGSGGVFKR